MAIPTTGTVSVLAYDNRTVIDRAYGGLGLTPQQITGEKISIAQDLLSLILTDMVNTANPLWCLEKNLITLNQGQKSYPMFPGTNDVRNAFYRTMSNVTPAAFTSTTAAYTVDFGLNPAGTNNDTFVSTWSINWGSNTSIPVTFQQSEDSVTWTLVGSSSNLGTQSGTGVIWYDMSTTNATRYWRVIPTVTTPPPLVAAVLPAGITGSVYNNPADVLMYRMNADDYFNMTNKDFPGRPLQFWLDRKLVPEMKLWPQPNLMASQNVMVVYRQRLIMDVGSLQQAMELPARWFLTVIKKLSSELGPVTPEADPAKVQIAIAQAAQYGQNAWQEERDKSPVKFQVNMRQYTR
jgi:hypothetical protein